MDLDDKIKIILSLKSQNYFDPSLDITLEEIPQAMIKTAQATLNNQIMQDIARNFGKITAQKVLNLQRTVQNMMARQQRIKAQQISNMDMVYELETSL